MVATKVRKIRATKGAEGAKKDGKHVKVLSLPTQYAVDRFGVYVQRRMRIAQIRAMREGLPELGRLRDRIKRVQGKDSADFLLVQETIQRYVGLYNQLKKHEESYKGIAALYDADIDRQRYG